jgi:uncharacterized MAPEG superfamily protein
MIRALMELALSQRVVVIGLALVLVAHISNRANGISVLGEEIFFWARLLHGIVYVIGIPWVRTLLWVISVIGMLLIFQQLV